MVRLCLRSAAASSLILTPEKGPCEPTSRHHVSNVTITPTTLKVIQEEVCTSRVDALSQHYQRSVLCGSLLLGSAALLAFIIAECGAKVRIIAHGRLISSPLHPHMHRHAHVLARTHSPIRTYFMFHLAYPCHYPAADVTRAFKPLHCPAVRDYTDLPTARFNFVVQREKTSSHQRRQALLYTEPVI